MDERPIRPMQEGKTNTMEEEQPVKCEQTETGPLNQRLFSKSFLTREAAFKELMTQFSTCDPTAAIFTEFTSSFIKFMNDKHPHCLESAMMAIEQWSRKTNSFEMSNMNEFMGHIIEKCFSCTKQTIKDTSVEIMCNMFTKGMKAEMFTAFQNFLMSTNPRIQSSTISMIIEMLINFGPQEMEMLKPFYTNISTISQSKFFIVRQSCLNFYREAYKWIGDALKPMIFHLRKQQQTELEKFFKEYNFVQMTPKKHQKQYFSFLDGCVLMQQVEIFSKYQESWCNQVMSTPTWQMKMDMLQKLIKDLNTPMLHPSNHDNLVTMVTKLLKEQNLNLHQAGIKIIGLLSNGLRKNFSAAGKILFPKLMANLGMRRNSMIDETFTSMMNLMNMSIINCDEFFSEFKMGMSNKNPTFKINLMSLLDRMLTKNPMKVKNIMKEVIPNLRTLFQDQNGEVRDKSLNLFGKIQGSYGNQFGSNALENLDSKKMNKIQKMADEIQAPFLNSQKFNSSNKKSQIETVSDCKKKMPASLKRRMNDNNLKEQVKEYETIMKKIKRVIDMDQRSSDQKINMMQKVMNIQGKNMDKNKENISQQLKY